MEIYRHNEGSEKMHTGRSMSFSEEIKKARKASGLTQYECGEKIGVSWITIWRWENKQNLPDDNVKEFWLGKVRDLK